MSQLNQINKITAAANDTRLIEQELAVYTYIVVNSQVHTIESLMIRFSVRLPRARTRHPVLKISVDSRRYAKDTPAYPRDEPGAVAGVRVCGRG